MRRKARRPSTRSITRRNALVTKHTKLVHSVAKRFRAPGVDYDNLVQEGNVGLIRAADRYNAKRGKFSTYATPWIKKHVYKAVRGGFSVRVPEKKLKTAIRPKISNIDIAEGVSSDGGIRRAHARASLAHLQKRLGRLPAQQQRVMRLRYFSKRPMTARQVAKKLKVSPARISQIERASRTKLRGAS